MVPRNGHDTVTTRKRCPLQETNPNFQIVQAVAKPLYEACPESKVTKVLNMYKIFNLQKRHCE